MTIDNTMNNFKVGEEVTYNGKGGEILRVTILEREVRGCLEEYKLRVENIVKHSNLSYLHVSKDNIFSSRKFNLGNDNNWYLSRE